MRSLADEDLSPLITMIREERGIDLAKYKDKYLRRRISVRLRASGAFNFNHYLKLIRQDEKEYKSFIDTLTINTSSFFRNTECFEVIADKILPEMASLSSVSLHPPFIWSVGCARGEEAYSLAMLLAAFPSLNPDPVRPPVLATDIDRFALEEARAGEYNRRAAASVPQEKRVRFFTGTEKGYRVLNSLKGLVTFACHDILRDNLPGRFLVVLCRNLLIYLEKEAQEKVMSRLADALRPGGYFVLGKSEILIGEARDQFVPVSASERIYRKRVIESTLPLPASRRKE